MNFLRGLISIIGSKKLGYRYLCSLSEETFSLSLTSQAFQEKGRMSSEAPDFRQKDEYAHIKVEHVNALPG